MKTKVIFRFLAKINKLIFPSFSKKRLNLKKANKVQMLVLAYRYYITKNAL